MSERTRSAYQRWAATYDSDPNPQTALEYEAVLEAVDAGPSDRILDAACGTGRYAVAFAKAGAEVTGIDFSDSMLDIARSRLPASSFRLGDISLRLPFRDAEFTKLCCAQALKHLPILGPTLREFFRVLRPGGRLVFTVTHPDMVWDGYDMRVTPDFILSQEADIHHHAWRTYEAALDQAGFVGSTPHDLPVSAAIARFLTADSFARVVGRPQVLLWTASRPAEL